MRGQKPPTNQKELLPKANPFRLPHMLDATIHSADCAQWTKRAPPGGFHLTFLDPPFNQGKSYRRHDDKQDEAVYWQWMRDILASVRDATAPGGWVYFMQREKNTEPVLRALRESGWQTRNLIIWKKMTSAVPCSRKFGLSYQIIAAAVNGKSPRLFHRLRIQPPPKPNHKAPPPPRGVYVTDIWDDIREMTSGYFAGPEALRSETGERFHKQQAPLALLGRIILSSTNPGDIVFDPFAGTGTTLIAAALLHRRGIGVELDPVNVNCIRERASNPREADRKAIAKLQNIHSLTEDFPAIWGGETRSSNFVSRELQQSAASAEHALI